MCGFVCACEGWYETLLVKYNECARNFDETSLCNINIRHASIFAHTCTHVCIYVLEKYTKVRLNKYWSTSNWHFEQLDIIVDSWTNIMITNIHAFVTHAIIYLYICVYALFHWYCLPTLRCTQFSNETYLKSETQTPKPPLFRLKTSCGCLNQFS